MFVSVTEKKDININSGAAALLLESSKEVDPTAQIFKKQIPSFPQGQEGKAKVLADRTELIISQKTDTVLPTVDTVSDKKSTSFKKYSELFSDVDKTRSLEKAKEFHAANESKIAFESSCSPEFIKKTKEEILEICHWKSGRELFRKLFEFYPKFKYGQSCKSGASPSGQVVKLAPEEQYYYTYINENNEQELRNQPDWITHVHELIHLHKEGVEHSSMEDLCDDPTLGPEFHNMEEQKVITGFGPSSFAPISENLFHYLSETPYRSSHGGAMVRQEGQPLTAIDCVFANAMGTLKKINCDINAPGKINEKNVHPLTYACHYNNSGMVDYLIKNGADLNVTDDYGSPLHASLNHEKREGEDSCALLRQLIRSGANVNCRNGENLTPLMHAFNFRDFDAMQALIEEGADINCSDDSGETLLMVACRKDLKAQFELLIKGKADIHLKDKSGRTALMIARQYNNEDIAKRLIEAGARDS